VQSQVVADHLLGQFDQVAHGTEAEGFGAAGSFTIGGRGQYAFDEEFSLLGGIAYSDYTFGDVEASSAVTVAAALRWLLPNELSMFRPFAEFGGWVTPEQSLSFERDYPNGAGTATGEASADGTLGYIFGRGGVVSPITPSTWLTLAGEIGHEWLWVDDSAESGGPGNPFPAQVSSGTDTMVVVRAKAQLTQDVAEHVALKVTAGVGHGFAGDSDLEATVAGATFTTGFDDATWAEYGGGVSFDIDEQASIDAFVEGISGDGSIGTEVHGGVGFRWRF
jgi:hypothetical protein